MKKKVLSSELWVLALWGQGVFVPVRKYIKVFIVLGGGERLPPVLLYIANTNHAFSNTRKQFILNSITQTFCYSNVVTARVVKTFMGESYNSLRKRKEGWSL